MAETTITIAYPAVPKGVVIKATIYGDEHFETEVLSVVESVRKAFPRKVFGFTLPHIKIPEDVTKQVIEAGIAGIAAEAGKRAR